MQSDYFSSRSMPLTLVRSVTGTFKALRERVER